MIKRYFLRGGGCASSINNQVETPVSKIDNLDENDFFQKFNQYINIIDSKSQVAINSEESQEIMIAIQWFVFQEENIYKLNKNPLSVQKSYDLILEGIKILLKSCLIYIKTDSFKCFYILQITTSLSKVIFSFHLINNERYMKFNTQKQYIEIIDELQVLIGIEKNDLIYNQLEIFLLLTKTSFELAPNDSNEKSEILKGCLKGIIISVLKMSPNSDLLESLYQGACLLYKMYNISSNRKQYEVFYYIDMLQWEIVSYFKDDKYQNLEEIISQIEMIYDKLVRGSNCWSDHFCWIQMIGKILIYNPLLKKKQLEIANQLLNIEIESVSNIWKELFKKGILMQLNHNNDQAIILLHQLQNKKLIQTNRLSIEVQFQGWENFLLLKDFLMDDQYSNKVYTIGSYLKGKLNIGNQNFTKNGEMQMMDQIEKLMRFIIPSNLLTLLRKNDDKLGVVFKNLKNLVKNKKLNKRITQVTFKQQIQNIICNLKGYFENTKDILKIINLNQNTNLIKSKQNVIDNFTNLYNLNYVMRLLKYILELFIEECKEYINDQTKEDKLYEKMSNINIFLEFMEYIQVDLKNLYFQDPTSISQVNSLLEKVIALPDPFKNLNNFIKETLDLIKYLQNTQQSIQKLIDTELQNSNPAICFEVSLQGIFLKYTQINDQLNKNFDEQMAILKQMMIINNEIDDISLTDEKLLMIKQKLIDFNTTKLIQKLRFEVQILKFNLIAFQEKFQSILKFAQQEELSKILQIINLEGFLLEVVNNFPKRIFDYNNKFYKKSITELKTIQLSEEDLSTKLSRQIGVLEYLLFQVGLEEQINDAYREDLELIEKEFGDLFRNQSSSKYVDKIEKVFEDAQINESLKILNDKPFSQQTLNLEIEKYENFYNQLILFQKEISKNISNHLKVGALNDLINQTQIVLNTLKTSLNQNVEIQKILIEEEIIDLQNKKDVFKKQFQEQSDMKSIKLNDEKEEKAENKIEKKNVNDSQVEILDFKSDEKFTLALWIFTLSVKLQQKLLIEEKQILNKILEEIKQYSSKICQFQKYKAETQAKLHNNFNLYLLQFITNYENIQWIGQDLQKEKENSRIYFDKLKISLDQVKNENKKICDENNIDQYISIDDFLNGLKVFSQEQSFDKGFIKEKISFEQELLIQKFSKIYSLDNQEIEIDDELNQKQTFFETMIQKYNDFKNNDEWKIKQGLIFTIIQISSNCFSDIIIAFCQKALIQIWTSEKDQRVRNLLKHQDMIAKQVQILQKDWRTQQDRISSQMQQMLRKIDDLQEQIFHEANLTKRDQQLQELDETTQQLDEQIENISEMGQQLKLITDFVNHIRKGLNRVEVKINQMKEQLKSMGDDIKSLRGKSVQQLLEIRKWKVLKEAAQKNVKTVYIPLKSQDKRKSDTNNLMNLEQFDDLSGEVNTFLLKEKETVLLIHGVAGSGKSTVAKKIEEFIWKLNESNIKVNEYVLVPIYISLPSVKNPAFQIIEEALRQDEYGFDDLQLKECKELLETRKFRFLILMDSYDEMKLENIKKNLYIINKLYSNWSNPLVIFTTRSEILTSSNYSDWFAPEDKTKLKEIQILKFDQIQKKEYIKQFTNLSIKVLVFEIYEWQTKMLNKISIDIQKFEIFWHKFQTEFLKLSPIKTQGEILLQKKQIEEILLFLKNDQFITLQSNEALRRLDINLQKLWSVEKYEAMIKMINLDKLIDTPYMMEIIVQVLPQMLAKVTEILQLKQNFIKNFSKKIQELLMSLYLIKLYKQQTLKSSNLLKNAQDEQTPAELIIENNQQDQCNEQDIENLKKIDYIQLSIEIWNILEQNQFFSQFQLSEINELNQRLIYIIDFNNFKNILFQFEVIKKVSISNERIANLICESLREQNLTSYDFYEEFISQYHLKQIEKQRNLGKSINTDRFLYDLQKYQIKLAKQMSIKEVTQIQYQQQGFLYKDETDDNKWLNEFFNDDGQDGNLKKDIRSCSFVKQKGTSFQFVHKSISEFLIASDIFEVLMATKDFEKSFLERCMKILENEKVKDCLLFLEKHVGQNHYEMCIQNNSLSLYEKQKQLDLIERNFKKIMTLLRIIKQHDLNNVNYSTQNHRETRKFLIQKIQNEEKIIEFLQFIVHLTALDDSFIQSGSNCINFLVGMKIDLTRQSFRNIKIKNTSLNASNFAFSDLSGSEFENVNIDGINLNGTLLYNCKWNNLQIYELHKIIGHKGSVYSLCFTSDGKLLASASEDKSIILWDVKLGQEKKKLEGHTEKVLTLCIAPDDSILASGSFDRSIRLWNIETGQQRCLLEGHDDFVQSLCFSPDGATLASGSYDCSIRLWDVKSGLEKTRLDGHQLGVYSVCFSPDGNTLASGSGDKAIRLWGLKTGQEKKKLEGHSGCVQSVKFSPDGATLASGSEDKSIRIWDLRLGQVKQIFEGHQNWIRSICFSPDGNILASGSQDKSIRIWDLRSGQEKKKLEGHRSWISTVCFSPDGTTLASGSGDKQICLWDVKSEKDNQRQQGKSNWVFSVCFSPDGTILASGNGDNSIRLWEAKSGKEKNTLEGHRSWVYSVCFSPDGTLLASGSDDKSIRLWDVESGLQKNLLELHTQEIYSICFSPDGNTLASGSEDKSILLWDVMLWKQKVKIEGSNGSVLSVCFSPDGLILASGFGDNSIILWDVDSGQQKLKLEGHNERVNSVCFSSLGDILASSSHDQSIRLWRVTSGEEIIKIEGNSRSICFSPDGTLFAFSSQSYSITIWDLNLMQEMYILEGHNDSVSQISFSPDSNLLVSSSYDKSIRLWDISLKQDKEFQQRAVSACLSPDGTTLATGCLDKLIRLWDLKSGDQKMTLIGHNQRVESVTFSPDGTILASGSFDASIYVWDTKSGNQKFRLKGHNKSVLSLCFSPNGTILASGSLDGSLRLWDVNTGNQKLKLQGLTNQVQSLCFSSDGTIVAQGALHKSINMWDINLDQQLLPSDSSYQEIFQRLQPNIEENLLQKRKFYDCLTVLRISQYEHFEAKGTQILQGQFINHFKMDLRRLFQQKGSIILEEQGINI